MTIEKAEKIEENEEDLYGTSKKNSYDKIVSALTIFKKYDKDINLIGEHDIVFFAEFNEKMTEDEIKELIILGFHLDEDSWAIFT